MVLENKHEEYMNLALKQAQKAFDTGEVPIGAVIIDAEGNCIGVGHNSVEADHTQTAHAEIKALAQATQAIKNWRLENCTLYVTLEPCSMCFSAITLSRLKVIVFGAYSPLFSYKNELDCFINPLKSTIKIIPLVCQKESSKLLKQFFALQRL